jgi:hypothetical protein
MPVSDPHDGDLRMRRRIQAVRIASATVVLVALGGLIASGPLQGTSATADAASSSAITVKWTGDSSAAASFQPDRVTSSPHYGDFDDISVSVSQTTGIIDQAIRVSVTGFAGTKSSNANGQTITNAQNYLQAMQCWGDDPLASNFNQTCQWGGRYTQNNGLGNSIYFDNELRVAPRDLDETHPTGWDVPFKTVDGDTVSGTTTTTSAGINYPILQLFSPSTTNEVNSARVGNDGTGFFDFETQTADTAPQLGCGTAAHLRCWLVIVPRGTHFGGDGEECGSFIDPANNDEPYTYGRPNSVQSGSPVNTHCDYWDNRINIPLTFAAVGKTCPAGAAEERVVGSQLMIGAMSSWQPSLCQTTATTFAFSTNPDAIAREQVLETGANSPILGFTGFPLSSGELTTADERSLLTATTMSYAPVAISGVVIAFFAENDGGRQEQLVLSPRLMAKLLTQSYTFTVPRNSSDPTKNVAHLGAVNRTYSFFSQDPEFQQLNPTNYNQFQTNPAIVLPGPSGADGIRQVWRWIDADTNAVAFLNGTPDPWGMTVNPYYLPKGNAAAVVPWYLDSLNAYSPTPVNRTVGLSNLDGSPMTLSQAVLDTFPKNDESLVPLQLGVETSRFDSIQFSPYTDTFLTGARQAFRADPNSRTVWDNEKLKADDTKGDWVSSGAQLPGSKFMIAITDSVSALRYSLNSASLLVPNTTTAVAPTNASMASALDALTATSLDSVTQVSPAQVSTAGYPLTFVTYAAVNLSKSKASERASIAAMLKQVTTSGQISGTGIGELPAGYLPLTTDLKALANASANTVQNYVQTTPTSSPSNYAQDPYDGSGSGSGSGASVGASTDSTSNPTLTPGVDSESNDRTEASPAEVASRSGLAISLGVGLAGFLIAPILFRGRGLL